MSDLLPAHPGALPKGRSIAEYEIVRVLGAGGFGITYLAFDHQLDGPVAIKEYFPTELATRVDGDQVAATAPTNQETFAWGLERFLDEARAVHRFRHPNVLRAHRYLEANGTAYLVMEYVEGESLKSILDRRGSLSAEEWRPWMDALLAGLEHVHSQGYLHRDIKPANIVVRSEDGEPVLIDFGSARLQHRDRTHTQVLTAAYAPIEQHSTGAAQEPPTDIYALAATSYRVLAGTPVSSAPDRVVNDDYEPLADRIAGPKLQWLAALDHGLAVKPQDRPQTVQQWRAELAATAPSRGPATLSSTARLDVPHDSESAGTAEPNSGTGNRASRASLGTPPSPSPDSPAVDAWKTQPQDGESEYRTGVLSRLGRTIMRPIAWVPAFIGDMLGGGFQDFSGAARWWRRAAHLGSAVAPGYLGVCYFHGTHPTSHQLSRPSELPRDHVEAAKWLRTAAVRGFVHGQPLLGLMYADGIELPRDYGKAERWCLKAAQGEPRSPQGQAAASGPLAQLVLGVVAARRREDSKAEYWFRRAASHDNAAAQYHLGSLIVAGRAPDSNDAEAANWLRRSADQGHCEAQNALGFMYASGRGVARDAAEAETRFKEAAKQDFALAQYNLGYLYTEREDNREAERQFRLAAENNEPLAQSALAYMCVADPRPKDDVGLGRLDHRLAEAQTRYRRAVKFWSRRAPDTEPSAECPTAVFGSNDRIWIPHMSHFTHANPGEEPDAIDLAGPNTWKYLYAYGSSPTSATRGSLTWFLKGAESGSSVAQYSLARLYQHGWGVAKDLSEALMWYRLAARQSYSPAQAALGHMLEEGHGVTQDRTEAFKWFREAAKRGEASAQCKLGCRYETGDGVPEDKVQAARWYGKAAARGDHFAQNRLSHLDADGYQCPSLRDVRDHWEWYLWAADQGSAQAQAMVGSEYVHRRDGSLSVKWSRKAAEQGNAEGQRTLAEHYEFGWAIAKDRTEAAKWYRRAAEQGDISSQFQLAKMHMAGDGVPKDESEAVKWWQLAARQGKIRAHGALAFAYENGRGMRRDYVRAYAWFAVGGYNGDCQRMFDRLTSEDDRDRARRLAAEYLFHYCRRHCG